jgi:hypothetical protein
MMLCCVCEEEFLEGEAMVKIPAMGYMHQNCESPWKALIDKLYEEDKDDSTS